MTKRGERSAGSLAFLLFMIIMLITYLVADCKIKLNTVPIQ
ncbi:Protein of unknown function [Lactobacillus delbrueckii subsp. lactis]|nr:Protein of unknown function [Lactobacillus delbrueckii subsp. lactis]